MSNARQILPVPPDWLLNAVGLARFDTSQPLEGPFPVHGDRVEIRSRQSTIAGDITQITVVDQWEGTVVEQDAYSAQGQLLAVARASRFLRTQPPAPPFRVRSMSNGRPRKCPFT